MTESGCDVSEDAPTRVVLYTWGPGDRVPAAEFRWSEDSGVTLTIINSDWGRFAQEVYDNGVLLRAERALVLPSAGPEFMRALLQPFWRMSYYAFVDESASESTA